MRDEDEDVGEAGETAAVVDGGEDVGADDVEAAVAAFDMDTAPNAAVNAAAPCNI